MTLPTPDLSTNHRLPLSEEALTEELMTPLQRLPSSFPGPEVLLEEDIDPRDDPDSPPSLVAMAHNLAALGLHPAQATCFSGYPHLQTQLDIAAQYARIAEYAQAQVNQSRDRVGWLGVIEAIGPLQAPYLNPVLHFLGPFIPE